MKIVLANGVFDILHYGHLLHLLEARTMGDMLIVSVTEDEHVNKGPGRPINALEQRMAILRALKCVGMVISTPCAITAILRVKPDIFVKGIDYAGGDKFSEDVARACAKVGAEIRYTQTPKMSVTEDIIAKTKEIAYGHLQSS